jgi:hypothetical protein
MVSEYVAEKNGCFKKNYFQMCLAVKFGQIFLWIMATLATSQKIEKRKQRLIHPRLFREVHQAIVYSPARPRDFVS